MKVLKVLLIILFTFGCAINIQKIPKDRSPANVKKDCIGAVGRLINPIKNRQEQLRRLKKFRRMLKEENLEEVKKVLWDSHDNFDKEIEDYQSLKGFSKKWERLLETLNRLNSNDFTPSYFFLDNYGTSHVISTFRKFDDLYVLENMEKMVLGEDGKEAVKNANNWVDEYLNYKNRLFEVIDQGAQSHLQAKALEPSFLSFGKKLKFWKKRDSSVKRYIKDDFFFGKKINFELPIIEDNKVYFVDKVFARWHQMANLYDGQKLNAKNAFTRNLSLDEFSRSSAVYNVMTEQAALFRRLTLIRDVLETIPVEFRIKNTEINDLYIKVTQALSVNEVLPRSDAVRHLQIKVVLTELKLLLSPNFIIKRLSKNLKGKEKEAFEKIGTNDGWMKFIKIGAILTAGGVGSTQFLPSFIAEDDTFNMGISWISNYYKNSAYGLRGTTDEIIKCSKEDRAWSVLNACFVKILFKHTSFHFFKSRKYPEYNFLKDKKFLTIALDISTRFAEQRKKKKFGSFFVISQGMYLEGERIVVDNAQLESMLRIEYFQENQVVKDKVIEFVQSHRLIKNHSERSRDFPGKDGSYFEEKFKLQEEELKDILPPEIYLALTSYFGSINKLVKIIVDKKVDSNSIEDWPEDLKEFSKDLEKAGMSMPEF